MKQNLINEVRIKDSFAVGDTVLWRGGFNLNPPVKAVIIGIEISSEKRSKYGEDTTSALWSQKEYCVVSLDNGHWAYGEQIFPLPESEPPAGSEILRIAKMLHSWKETGKAYSNLVHDDSAFFELLGLNVLDVNITSRCGTDIVYTINQEMYERQRD